MQTVTLKHPKSKQVVTARADMVDMYVAQGWVVQPDPK